MGGRNPGRHTHTHTLVRVMLKSCHYLGFHEQGYNITHFRDFFPFMDEYVLKIYITLIVPGFEAVLKA